MKNSERFWIRLLCKNAALVSRSIHVKNAKTTSRKRPRSQLLSNLKYTFLLLCKIEQQENRFFRDSTFSFTIHRTFDHKFRTQKLFSENIHYVYRKIGQLPFRTSHIRHLNASAVFLNVQTLQSHKFSSTLSAFRFCRRIGDFLWSISTSSMIRLCRFYKFSLKKSIKITWKIIYLHSHFFEAKWKYERMKICRNIHCDFTRQPCGIVTCCMNLFHSLTCLIEA